MQQNLEYDHIARELAHIAVEAGDVIRSTVERGITQTIKPDGSECSNADLAAQAFILERLSKRFAGIDVVAEEQAHDANALNRSDTFFLVDPLDGTRNFLSGGKEFAVNIALIDQGKALAGVIHAPASGRTWLGGKSALFAPQRHDWEEYLRPIHVRELPVEGITALASHRRGDPQSVQFLNQFVIARTQHMSSSIKFGVIAQGLADLYVRYGPTMEWDSASGHVILNAAGGALTLLNGDEKTYGHASRGYLNEAFVAWGNRDMAYQHYTKLLIET